MVMGTTIVALPW